MTRASPTKLGAPTLWRPEDDAKLCELIAEGVRISHVGPMIGVTKCVGIGRFQRIRGHYGWQAS